MIGFYQGAAFSKSCALKIQHVDRAFSARIAGA